MVIEIKGDNLKLKQTVSLSAPVFLLPCVVGYPPKHFLTPPSSTFIILSSNFLNSLEKKLRNKKYKSLFVTDFSSPLLKTNENTTALFSTFFWTKRIQMFPFVCPKGGYASSPSLPPSPSPQIIQPPSSICCVFKALNGPLPFIQGNKCCICKPILPGSQDKQSF